ncbi:MAG: hypothetical protein ACRCTZ_13710 [Sarcina sp.]
MLKTFYRNFNGSLTFLSILIMGEYTSGITGIVRVLPKITDGDQEKDENGNYQIMFNNTKLERVFNSFEDFAIELAAIEPHSKGCHIEMNEVIKPSRYFDDIALHMFHRDILDELLKANVDRIDKSTEYSMKEKKHAKRIKKNLFS